MLAVCLSQLGFILQDYIAYRKGMSMRCMKSVYCYCFFHKNHVEACRLLVGNRELRYVSLVFFTAITRSLKVQFHLMNSHTHLIFQQDYHDLFLP